MVEYTHPIRVDIVPTQNAPFSGWKEGTLTLKLEVLDHAPSEEREATFSRFRFGSSTVYVLNKHGCTPNRFGYAVFASLRFATTDGTILDLRPGYRDERGLDIKPADLVNGLFNAKHTSQNWDNSRDRNFSIRLTVESYLCPFEQPPGWVVEDSPRAIGEKLERPAKKVKSRTKKTARVTRAPS